MSSKRRIGKSHLNSAPSSAGRVLRSPTAEAAESERLALEFPQQREELLVQAAGEWVAAGEHVRALELYDDLLAGEPAERSLIEAFRVSALWDAGRVGEAREAAAALRAQHLRDGGAWNVVAEMYETAGELTDAAEWFTVAVTRLMGPAAPPTVEAVEQLPYEYDIETLVIGRHRVRRRLGAPHDALDGLADQLHEHRNRWQGEVTPLDRLHDPPLERELLHEQIEALRARNQELSDEVAARRAGLARPQLMCALYWPETEFGQLLARWPSLVDVYGDDHAAHRRQVERTLRRLSDQGGTHLAVAPGTVSGLEDFAREEGVAPDESEVRAAPGTLRRVVPASLPPRHCSWEDRDRRREHSGVGRRPEGHLRDAVNGSAELSEAAPYTDALPDRVATRIFRAYNLLYAEGVAMKTMSYSESRAKYAEVLNAVTDDREEIVITRAGHEPVVIVSLEDYESLKETAYLLRSPANARRLLASIEELESGGGTVRELADPE